MSFCRVSIPTSRYAWINQEEIDASPNKQEVISHLRLWVYETYKDTPQNPRARRYLDLCIRKIDLQGLFGSTLALIHQYKSQIHHALERDQLSYQVALLRFQQDSLEKLEMSRETRQIQIEQNKELELEGRVKALQWEHQALESIRLVRLKRKQTTIERSPVEREIEDKITSAKSHIEKLEQECRSLRGDIQVEKHSFQHKKQEITSLEKIVDQCFTETLRQEEKLQKHRAFCLQKIKELQEEIDQDIEKIKLEPERLQTDFKTLDEEFRTKIEKILADFRTQLTAASKEQEAAIKAQQEGYKSKLEAENEGFRVKKETIQQKYNRLGQENYEAFKKKYKELLGRFNEEVILNRDHFVSRWNTNNTTSHQERNTAFHNGTSPAASDQSESKGDGGGSSQNESKATPNRMDNLSDGDPVVAEVFQERNAKIQSQRNAVQQLFTGALSQIGPQRTQYERTFLDRYNKQVEEVNTQNRTFRRNQEALNQQIKEKLEHLLGRKR